MNQHPLATTPAAPPQIVFLQRIEQLCTENNESPTTLGTKAGLSKQVVRTWMGKAKVGKLKRTDDLHKLATHYKRTVEWLLGETMLVEVPPEALRPDTKAMAEEAIEMLVDIDGLSRGAAAERMLGIYLSQPSVKGFYKAARLKDAPRTTDDDLDTSKKKPKKTR